MEYKTQKSVMEDYQEGNITQELAIELLLKMKKLQQIKRETKKLVKRLNQAASNAGFVKPN
jgi:hypothetical protein